jgi:hypothetical protein
MFYDAKYRTTETTGTKKEFFSRETDEDFLRRF